MLFALGTRNQFISEQGFPTCMNFQSTFIVCKPNDALHWLVSKTLTLSKHVNLQKKLRKQNKGHNALKACLSPKKGHQVSGGDKKLPTQVYFKKMQDLTASVNTHDCQLDSFLV